MKFHSLETLPARPNDRVFKTPLLGCVVSLAVFSVLAGVSLYGGVNHNSLFPTGVCYGTAAFAACASWLAFCGLRACCKPSNWILRGNDQSLAIKYRSFRNWRMPADDIQIVELAFSEIAWARAVKELCESTSLGGEKRQNYEFYLDLSLVNPDTTDLEAHLREEQNRKCSTILHHDYPVQVVPGGIIRIRWQNHGGGALSTPKSALNWLKRHVKVVNPEASKVDLSSAKPPEELNAKVLQLLKRGDEMAAIALVSSTYASSITEAKAYVANLKMTPKAEE